MFHTGFGLWAPVGRRLAAYVLGLVVTGLAAAPAPLHANEQDRDFVQLQLNNILEFERTAQVIPWKNPDTGNRGVVLIERTYFFDPKTPCRDYMRTFEQDGKLLGLRGTGCREGAGRWRLTEDEAPSEQVPENLRDWAARPDTADLRAADDGRIGKAPTCGAESIDAEPDALAEPAAFTGLDLVFVLDMSGSMGEERADLRSQIWHTVKILRGIGTDLNAGVVAYKDRGEDYLTREFTLAPMTDAKMTQFETFMMALEARGGGDQPEAVDRALKAAAAMPWRGDALGLIVVVGDAATHRGRIPYTLDLAEQFHSEAPLGPRQRQVSTVFTGRNATGRRFFDQLAHAGGGGFVGDQARLVECVLLSVLPPRHS